MAARYASSDDAMDGLALLAAYPEGGLDLSTSDLAVTSVYGTDDGVASPTGSEGGSRHADGL